MISKHANLVQREPLPWAFSPIRLDLYVGRLGASARSFFFARCLNCNGSAWIETEAREDGELMGIAMTSILHSYGDCLNMG